MARVLAEAVAGLLPRGAVWKNRGGAGGNIAPPPRPPAQRRTGHERLLQCSFGPCGANPSLYPNPGYDLLAYFAPVILTGAVRNVMSARRWTCRRKTCRSCWRWPGPGPGAHLRLVRRRGFGTILGRSCCG